MSKVNFLFLDEESLKQLEAKLNEAESDFNEANLDEQLRVLTTARLLQVNFSIIFFLLHI